MKPCCALREGIRRLKQGRPIEGDRFACTVAQGCGQHFIRRRWRWEPVSAVDEIRDLNATHPLATRHNP